MHHKLVETQDRFGNKYIFDDKFMVEYFDVDQILNMMGPLVGRVRLNGNVLLGLFSGPPNMSKETGRLLMPRHNIVSGRLFSTAKIRFTVFVVDTRTGELFESKRKFRLMFIEEMQGDSITVYGACHNRDAHSKSILLFNMDNFHRVGHVSLNEASI
jgi:hypothetical protein